MSKAVLSQPILFTFHLLLIQTRQKRPIPMKRGKHFSLPF